MKSRPAYETSVVKNGVRTLPFRTAGSIKMRSVGNETIGILDIPVYGGVLSGEAFEFSQLMRSEQRKTLLERVAGRTEEEINKLVEAGDLNQLEMAEVMGLFAMESATIILKYRVDPDWTLEDTRRLPMELVTDLSVLLQEEMNSASANKPVDDEETAGQPGEPLNPPTTQQS